MGANFIITPVWPIICNSGLAPAVLSLGPLVFPAFVLAFVTSSSSPRDLVSSNEISEQEVYLEGGAIFMI